MTVAAASIGDRHTQLAAAGWSEPVSPGPQLESWHASLLCCSRTEQVDLDGIGRISGPLLRQGRYLQVSGGRLGR